MSSENGTSEPISSGLHLALVLTIKPENFAGDSFAVGACLQDLRREGWVLTDFMASVDGVRATLQRGWQVAAIRPPEMSAPKLVVAEEMP